MPGSRVVKLPQADESYNGTQGYVDPENPKPPRLLKGASLFQYSQREINHLNTLLGKRYLCRGGGLFIVAPSGHGKSVFTAQAAIELGCGLTTFGIPNPNGPLKSLIIQSEDDEDDITEMSKIIDHLELDKKQRELVDQNTHVEFVNDLIGTDFLDACNSFLNQWKADILWINPYTAYLGGDIKDDGVNTRFLRNGLNPILTSHCCGGAIIHHTPKTNNRDTTDWKPSDWMYSGAGAAVLTNWARAYLVIDPCEIHGVYKLIAAKRGKRIGWGDAFPVYETYWAHSRQEDTLLWQPADSDQIASTQAAPEKTPDDLLKLIPVLDPLLQKNSSRPQRIRESVKRRSAST
jgi:RecA-family ATPase